MQKGIAENCGLIVSMASILIGCKAFQQTSQQVTIRVPGDRFLSAPSDAQPEAAKHLDFARMSETAYERTPTGQERAASDRAQADAALTKRAGQAPSPCPDSLSELEKSRWKRWPDFPSDGLKTKIEQSHLRVQVWTRPDPPSVAVAFGGTVFESGKDWKSNFRWFIWKHKDEYTEIVNDFGPAFVEEYKQRSMQADWLFLKNATLYSTGHSLGGGLAQQFAYSLPVDSAVPRVTQVYAFDPSPVTGYYSVDAPTRDDNKKTLAIDRIYERGEILAIVRSFMSLIYPPNDHAPLIRGVRYNLFYTINPVSGHSITELACKLSTAAALNSNR